MDWRDDRAPETALGTEPPGLRERIRDELVDLARQDRVSVHEQD
ncbi:hypothetical protein [Curtobacterium sp. 9128]|nr:hypothetical protein [Curtobacterium sp. 9128]